MLWVGIVIRENNSGMILLNLRLPEIVISGDYISKFYREVRMLKINRGLQTFRIEPLDFEKQWGGKKMSKKVYCKDCKFFNKSFIRYSFWNWHECRLACFLADEWLKRIKKYRWSCATRNKKNNCKLYKPRWWRRLWHLG